MPSIIRRMRTRTPTCISVGFGLADRVDFTVMPPPMIVHILDTQNGTSSNLALTASLAVATAVRNDRHFPSVRLAFDILVPEISHSASRAFRDFRHSSGARDHFRLQGDIVDVLIL